MIKNIILKLLLSSKYWGSLVACYTLRKNSYLNSAGWFQSFYSGMPQGSDENPIPWYTYGAIDFIKNRLNERMAVFEYGSGNSTIWWASHVDRVVSCEHEKHWYLKMKRVIPDNVDYLHVECIAKGEYSRVISRYSQKFDIIVIDGRDRVSCVLNAVPALKEGGVIVWDNSDREQYGRGYEFLLRSGFKRLDFSGMGPINTYGWCTSIFYNKSNCLGL